MNLGIVITGHGVRDLALFGGEMIFVGGRFMDIGGAAHSNIARLSLTDASADPEFNPMADGDVIALTIASGGRPVVAGDFIAISGQPRRSLAIFPGDDTIFADGFEQDI